MLDEHLYLPISHTLSVVTWGLSPYLSSSKLQHLRNTLFIAGIHLDIRIKTVTLYSKMPALKSMLNIFFRGNWEIFFLIIVELLLYRSSATVSTLPINDDKFLLLSVLMPLMNHFHRVAFLLFSALLILCLFIPFRVRHRRKFIDIFAAYCSGRLLMFFAIINILLFLPRSEERLLLIQLILFLPCFLLMWGWVYWRIDLYCSKTSGKTIFRIDSLGEKSPSAYDYVLASFTSLVSNTLKDFSGRNRVAKTLIFIHGAMMWDLMWLILTRAIAMREG